MAPHIPTQGSQTQGDVISIRLRHQRRVLSKVYGARHWPI